MKAITSMPVAALTVGILLVGIAGFAPPAAAELVLFTASLDQAQTAPPAQPAPGATGQAAVILDTETNQISWVVDYIGLSGILGALHFHGPAPAGQPAGVQVDIGAASGTDRPLTSSAEITAEQAADPQAGRWYINTDRPLIGSAEITAEQAADLQAGQWYINLHTAANPPGEIRGQVTAN